MGLGTAEILRLLYKHYGGLNFFEDKSINLLSKCLQNAVKKEQEIPNIIMEIINKITGNETEKAFSNKKMRSAKEILKDYGLG